MICLASVYVPCVSIERVIYLIMSATVFAAVIFDSCAFLPVCLSPPPVFITTTGACMISVWESMEAGIMLGRAA